MTGRNELKICQPMEDVGITDPLSKEAIDFCSGGAWTWKGNEKCPYKECRLFGSTKYYLMTESRIKEVEILHLQGLKGKEIASRLRVTTKTIYRYIKIIEQRQTSQETTSDTSNNQ